MSGIRDISNDGKETQSLKKKTETLSDQVKSAIQGEIEKKDSRTQDNLGSVDDLPPLNQEEFITVHPHNRGPEYLPSPEIEPQSINKSDVEFPNEAKETEQKKEGKIQPPEGWRPGGVEGGG